MAIEPCSERRWVLLPGTLCTGDVFDGLLDALDVPRRARHSIVLDRPDVGDYLQELSRMTDDDTVVCGFSLGAIVAAHCADRLAASHFLLFGLNPYADDPSKREDRLALAREVHRLGAAAALASRLPPLAGDDPAASRALILSMAEESAAHIDAQTALALSRPGALQALARTQVPVTLLTGSADGQTPPSLAQSAADAAPRGTLVTLPNLGHYALLEDPVACSRSVDSILA